MIKHFDCVEMKHKASRTISKRIAKMTPQQQLKYWQKKHNELLELKENFSNRKKSVRKLNRFSGDSTK